MKESILIQEVTKIKINKKQQSQKVTCEDCGYEYNHQSVRYKKTVGSQVIQYINDGSRILGEDRTEGGNLRYFYDAIGVVGVRHNNENYRFIRDEQGNVVKVFHIHHKFSIGQLSSALEERMVAEYDYDAWGNCKITAYDGDGKVIANPVSTHIANLNPWRWKSHYYDGGESGMYYISGRYYNPELGHYVDADTPENLLSCAFTLNSLDRNAVTVDNIVSVLPNMDAIFTASELYPDTYDENADKIWWQVHWKKAVQWIIFAVVLLVSVVLMCIPGTQAFGVAMFTAGMKCAISGYIIGGIIGGIVAAAQGNDFWEGIAEGAVYGFINGFSTGAILFCISQGISAIARVANSAKAKPTVTDNGFNNWLNQGEANNSVYKGISQSDKKVYTGITKQKIDVRLSQHNNLNSKYYKNFKRLDEVADGLTRNQARALETYKILYDNTSTLNRALSVRKTHRYFDQAMQWASIIGGL